MAFIVETSNPSEFPPHSSFDDMEGLSENLLRGVYAYGFEKPSAIQAVGIMPLVKRRDILAQAQSGTGKTGTFGIGLLSRLNMEMNAVQALVLAPTRELAEQIATVLRGIGSHMKVKICLAVGGVPRHQNIRDLHGGCQVVVGTLGRVFDLAQSGDLPFTYLQMLVIDEADEMLRDRSASQVKEIFEIGIPATCNIALFSATMPPEVCELASRFLTNPVRITLRVEDVKLDGIKQYYVEVGDDSQKLSCYQDLFQALTVHKSFVFCNTKDRAENLHAALTRDGFPVSVIYGEPMTTAIRQERMAEFRDGRTRVLIATNLLARGIDDQQVSMVFNFDMPPLEDKENYMHRVGRCGRFGRKGVAISFVTPDEKLIMDKIADHYGFKPIPLPSSLEGVME
jgi:translation initiation factor 4A